MISSWTVDGVLVVEPNAKKPQSSRSVNTSKINLGEYRRRTVHWKVTQGKKRSAGEEEQYR